MHGRLGSATLSQLAFPWGSNPNFPWEKSSRDEKGVYLLMVFYSDSSGKGGVLYPGHWEGWHFINIALGMVAFYKHSTGKGGIL